MCGIVFPPIPRNKRMYRTLDVQQPQCTTMLQTTFMDNVSRILCITKITIHRILQEFCSRRGIEWGVQTPTMAWQVSPDFNELRYRANLLGTNMFRKLNVYEAFGVFKCRPNRLTETRTCGFGDGVLQNCRKISCRKSIRAASYASNTIRIWFCRWFVNIPSFIFFR